MNLNVQLNLHPSASDFSDITRKIDLLVSSSISPLLYIILAILLSLKSSKADSIYITIPSGSATLFCFCSTQLVIILSHILMLQDFSLFFIFLCIVGLSSLKSLPMFLFHLCSIFFFYYGCSFLDFMHLGKKHVFCLSISFISLLYLCSVMFLCLYYQYWKEKVILPQVIKQILS